MPIICIKKKYINEYIIFFLIEVFSILIRNIIKDKNINILKLNGENAATYIRAEINK
jgi:hypothetical protein